MQNVARLDFGEPGVHVQQGFMKLGLPDGGSGTFTGSFPCQVRMMVSYSFMRVIQEKYHEKKQVLSVFYLPRCVKFSGNVDEQLHEACLLLHEE